jgi:hypothetical protein
VKQLRIVCGTTSPQHPKLSDSNGRHPTANSTTNGINEQIDRHRPSGASAVMNARDPMSKQKVPNSCEPGPLKRAQGIETLKMKEKKHTLQTNMFLRFKSRLFIYWI